MQLFNMPLDLQCLFCSTVRVVVTVRAVVALAVPIASACLSGQLKKVDDFNNISHDVRLVWMLLLGMLCETALTYCLARLDA